MKEYIFSEEKDIKINNHIVKFVGQIVVFKYDGYYKVGVAGIDEVVYFRVKTKEEVASFLTYETSVLDIDNDKFQKVEEPLVITEEEEIYNEYISTFETMDLEDRPEKGYESVKNEEIEEIEIKLEKETKLPFLKINGTELKDVKFKMNGQGQIELDSAIIPTELCLNIYYIVKSIKENVENLKN